MTEKTYELKEVEDEEAIEETMTTTATTKKTYSKKFLIEEIAKLQTILNEFPK